MAPLRQRPSFIIVSQGTPLADKSEALPFSWQEH